MPYQRILFQLAILALSLALVVLLALWAEAACRATWLPGDTLWTLRHLAGEALARIAGMSGAEAGACVAGGSAETISMLMGYAPPLLALLVLGQGLYEALRHSLRRMYYARRGGHALILGDAADVGPLVARETAAGRTLLLSRDAAAGQSLRQRHWSVPVVAADLAAPKLGMDRARMVAAVSASDVANLNLIEDLDAQGTGAGRRVILRLESPAMRAAQAARGGRFHEELSLDQGLFRRGAALGDPGPQFAAGHYPAHIVLLGGAPGMGDLALYLAGFGYGLERVPPQFTILGIGGAERSAAISRLAAAPELGKIHAAACDPTDSAGLERTLARIFTEQPVPCAIHCIGGAPGEAVAMALLAAATARSVAVDLPVIAYGRSDVPAPSRALAAGVSHVACDDLATALAGAERRDRMARAVHEAYLVLQRSTRGAAFGDMAAECEWADLPIAFRDDNRAVADHIGHMIRAMGLCVRPATGHPLPLAAEQIERMAAMAHARWMAGKLLAGWHHGPARDDVARLHPSLVPYAALSDSEKDKDREQIRAIPHILAILGEELGAYSDVGPSMKIGALPEIS